MAGNGDLFAYALLRKYLGQPLNLERAAILAYKVIEETIEVGAYGLGPPIDLWQVSDAGVKNLAAAETADLADAARKLRELEIRLLISVYAVSLSNAWLITIGTWRWLTA